MEDKLAAEHRATPARRHEPTVAAAPLSRARGTAGRGRRSHRGGAAGLPDRNRQVKGERRSGQGIRGPARQSGQDQPKAYAKKVAAAGSSAFVPAIVLRMDSPDLPRGSKIRAIPGALSIRTGQMLAPTYDFARPIIGIVGEATKENIDESGGAVVAGDQVGLTGLQKRYDAQMRGTPGVQVRLAAAKPNDSSASPSPTPSPTAEAEPVVLFEVKPVAGKPLTTTLNLGLQKLAERTLADTKPASALVAIRPSTGAIVAAANGQATVVSLSPRSVGPLRDPPSRSSPRWPCCGLT